MFIETAPSRPARPARANRRTDADRLREALIALAGGHGTVIEQAEHSWASVTFAGARHRLTLEFVGTQAIEAAEVLITDLPEHEFSLPRQLVADAAVCAVEHTLLPEPKLRVVCELLLVEDR